MGLIIRPDRVYEMPVFFGPSPGTKNPDENGVYRLNKPATVEAATVVFETDPDRLEAFLPKGFTLAAPVLSVAACEFGTLGNFSGNTYYLVNVSVPVSFDGDRDHLRGDLVLVMYENHADPILGGRDLMGYAKAYADIPRFAKDGRHVRTSAGDWGFTFLDVELDLEGGPADEELMRRLAAESQGKFNYKYIQATPEKGHQYHEAGADASYPTFNPKSPGLPEDYPFELMEPETHFCSGTAHFHAPEPWQMPMYWHIPAALAGLPVRRWVGAQFSRYNDPTDYNHVYRLR
ncbi:acetoacetate decarboxylase family protein [Propionibacterium australiense]|uniref:Acetoacetate decarboxylase beta barrel domain n=1 Tax=Propionibacterium australiense TaxID=119981 RepID=A0A383S7M1_9ACTN|nr:acetoacetate decarboxylase family protein [Propionibacterium australiense]SYZ33236.1 Acetoacetate decarboxylase beta barrel domain [Propionibacterium australiense]VEH89270.1 acetoacetate decarboxylase [Propionibacterium australiense]